MATNSRAMMKIDKSSKKMKFEGNTSPEGCAPVGRGYYEYIRGLGGSPDPPLRASRDALYGTTDKLPRCYLFPRSAKVNRCPMTGPWRTFSYKRLLSPIFFFSPDTRSERSFACVANHCAVYLRVFTLRF